MNDTTTTMSEPAYSGWALCEQMGFRKTVGKVREVEQFGTKMLRLDVPIPTANGEAPTEWTTRYCGGPSLYQVTPLAEDVALAMLKQQGDVRPAKPTGFKEIEDARYEHGGADDDEEDGPF